MKTTTEGFVVPGQQSAADKELARLRNCLSEHTCCSFQEWADAGYRIRAGVKSVFRDFTGIPQFTKEQVYRPPTGRSIYERRK